MRGIIQGVSFDGPITFHLVPFSRLMFVGELISDSFDVRDSNLVAVAVSPRVNVSFINVLSVENVR